MTTTSIPIEFLFGEPKLEKNDESLNLKRSKSIVVGDTSSSSSNSSSSSSTTASSSSLSSSLDNNNNISNNNNSSSSNTITKSSSSNNMSINKIAEDDQQQQLQQPSIPCIKNIGNSNTNHNNSLTTGGENSILSPSINEIIQQQKNQQERLNALNNSSENSNNNLDNNNNNDATTSISVGNSSSGTLIGNTTNDYNDSFRKRLSIYETNLSNSQKNQLHNKQHQQGHHNNGIQAISEEIIKENKIKKNQSFQRRIYSSKLLEDHRINNIGSFDSLSNGGNGNGMDATGGGGIQNENQDKMEHGSYGGGGLNGMEYIKSLTTLHHPHGRYNDKHHYHHRKKKKKFPQYNYNSNAMVSFKSPDLPSKRNLDPFSEYCSLLGMGRRAWAIIIGLFIVGASVSVLAILVLRYAEGNSVSGDFARVARDRFTMLRIEFNNRLYVSQTLALLLSVFPTTSEDQFLPFSNLWSTNSEGLEGIMWAPRVLDSGRKGWEDLYNVDIRENEVDPNDPTKVVKRPAKPAAEYYPLLFSEPEISNDHFRGYNIISDEWRIASLNKTRDTGEKVSYPSPYINKNANVPKNTSHAGLLFIFQAVYTYGSVLSTVEDRRKNIIGYASCRFFISRMVAASLNRLTEEDALDLYVFDLDSQALGELIYYRPSHVPDDMKESSFPTDIKNGPQLEKVSEIIYYNTMNVGGRNWMVVLTPSPEFVSKHYTFYPYAIGGVCLLLSGLVAIWFAINTKHNLKLSLTNADLHKEIFNRKLAERALAESQERLELAMEGSEDAVWDWKVNTGELHISSRWFQILKSKENHYQSRSLCEELKSSSQTNLTLENSEDLYSPIILEEILSSPSASNNTHQLAVWNMKYLSELIHPEDKERFVSEIKKTISRETSILEVECRIRKKLGGYLYIIMRGKVVSNENNSKDHSLRMAGTLRDVTSRKDIQRLILEKEAAEEANKAKSAFVATVSHEVRTPLSGVIGVSDLLLETNLNEEQKDYVQTIQKSSQALLTIINDILDYSKLESKQLKMESLPFSIVETVQAVIHMLSVAANEDVDLLLRVSPNVPKIVIGDAMRCRQVLLNLVSNAIKFTSSGHVLVDISLVDGNPPDHHTETINLCITVEDTGIGIPQSLFEAIFEPFSQADNSTTRKYGGTGLGLSITKRLIEDVMGGTIHVSSIVGKGSSFKCYIPFLLPSSSPSQLNLISPSSLPKTMLTRSPVTKSTQSLPGERKNSLVIGNIGPEILIQKRCLIIVRDKVTEKVLKEQFEWLGLVIKLPKRNNDLQDPNNPSLVNIQRMNNDIDIDIILVDYEILSDIKLANNCQCLQFPLIIMTPTKFNLSKQINSAFNPSNYSQVEWMRRPALTDKLIPILIRSIHKDQQYKLEQELLQNPPTGGRSSSNRMTPNLHSSNSGTGGGGIITPTYLTISSPIPNIIPPLELASTFGECPYNTPSTMTPMLKDTAQPNTPQQLQHDQHTTTTTTTTSSNSGINNISQFSLLQSPPFISHQQKSDQTPPPLSSSLQSNNNNNLTPITTPSNIPRRALLVEDNEINRKVLIQLLKKLSWQVIIAENGKEALKEITGERCFHIVLMDCQMPILDGFQTTRCIRSKERENGWKRMNIVALSAGSSFIQDCLDAGMDDFVSKPITLPTLKEALSKWGHYNN
ncbi:histidine kinase [Tieghemostelium lacteum]|uniref:histidine kinase n=1 Tax=Tieghemostelium lacteum TaxID=361077 RepID=A0A151ZID7_TIELA|nr:histidine kinase [Tieghemostelium lacteum]|eukprot:KYQ93726.1 histidine kinase [Tieghemostelium lacteum]